MISKKKMKDQVIAGASRSHGPCSDSHPALKVGGFEIYGGSCYRPIVRDAHIYVGHGSGMEGGIRFPWDGGVELCYEIQDRGVPTNPQTYKKLIDWLCNRLQSGNKIHVGCAAGHGRTGTTLSAVASVMGHDDAIQYVRKNYCKRAVESQAQIEFLVKHFGIKKAPPREEKVYQPRVWRGGDDDLFVPRSGDLLDPLAGFEYHSHPSQDPRLPSKVTTYYGNGSVKQWDGSYDTPKQKKAKIEATPSSKNIWER